VPKISLFTCTFVTCDIKYHSINQSINQCSNTCKVWSDLYYKNTANSDGEKILENQSAIGPQLPMGQ